MLPDSTIYVYYVDNQIATFGDLYEQYIVGILSQKSTVIKV